MLVLWDFREGTPLYTFELKQDDIVALAFSSDDTRLASVGGYSQGCLTLWDCVDGKALVSQPADPNTELVAFGEQGSFVTAGKEAIQVWETLDGNRLRPTKVRLNGLQRVISSGAVMKDGTTAVLGTTSGDAVFVSLSQARYLSHAPLGLVGGVQALALLENGELLAGAGDGTVAYAKRTSRGVLKVVRRTQVTGAVTSVSLRGAGHDVFCGTAACEMHHIGLAEFKGELRIKAHHAPINSVIFPPGESAIFATCTQGSVYIWSTSTGQLLLDVSLAGLECTSADIGLGVGPAGDSIMTGWDDGYLRFLAPESGKVQAEVKDAHPAGVTAVAFAPNNLVVSGGKDGQVRFWESVQGQRYKLLATTKDHKGKINSITVRAEEMECVTVSADGTCVIWDLNTLTRIKMMLAQTNFLDVSYARDEAHIVAVGGGGGVYYYQGFDGQIIREIELPSPLRALAVDTYAQGPTPGYGALVVGGDDRAVRVLDYDGGEVSFIGLGHCSAVTSVAVSPDNGLIVSGTMSGAMFLWQMPDVSPTQPVGE
eukprot:UC1_evm7s808